MFSLKSALAKPFAKHVSKSIKKWANNPVETQEKVFHEIIGKATSTQFGKDHDFIGIHSHADFVKRVPVRDYEDLKPYIERVVAGETDILWLENLYILQKHQEPLLEQNIFPLPKKACQPM